MRRFDHVFVDLLGSCLYLGAALEQQCNELMRTKFGRLVDLEALQMLSGNRRLEELKQEKLLKEAAYAKEIRQWDVCLSVCVRDVYICAVLIICKVNILKPLRVKFFLIFYLGCVCVQAKVEEARQAVMEVTTCNTEHLRSATSLNEQKKELQLKLSTSQKKMVNNVQG